MYCKSCGTKNSKSNNYCIKDGYPLFEEEVSKTLTKSESKFCNKCGNKVNKIDNYCNKCGSSLFVKKEKQNFQNPLDFNSFLSNFKDIKNKVFNTSTYKKINLDDRDKIKNFTIYGFIGVFIGLIFAIIGKLLFVKYLVEIDEFYDLIKMFPDFSLGVIDFLLLFISGSRASIKSNIELVDSAAFIQSTPGIFMIIPIISFLIMGIIKARKDIESKNLNFLGLITNPFVYGLVLSVLSIFSRKKMQTSIPLVNMDVVIKFSLSFFITFFSAFILSLIFFGMGYFLVIYKNNIKFKKENKNILVDSGVISLLVIFISLILSLIYMFIMNSNSFELSEVLLGLPILSYVGFLLLNIGSFEFLQYNDILDFNTFSFFEEVLQLEAKQYIFPLILGFATIFIVFFMIGRKYKRKKVNDFYLLPIFYSLIVFSLALILSFKIDLQAPELFDQVFESNLLLEPKLIRTFIGSILVSGLPFLAGYFIEKGAEN